MTIRFRLLLGIACACAVAAGPATRPTTQPRTPANDEDLRAWLQNMVAYHHFTEDEVAAATGLDKAHVADALRRHKIAPLPPATRPADAPLMVLPYPGGRHPRIGFLEGAIDPQRETKVSVFSPWAEGGYVVVDVPEAIFTNLGLTYLAHTHIPTIWDRQGVTLERLEWKSGKDGSLECERKLPNGIRFGTKVMPGPTAVHMELWLHNGTDKPLTTIRSQVCTMFKALPGFEKQNDEGVVKEPPFVARKCTGAGDDRWVIVAWQPLHRVWSNPPVPCIHSDPSMPDIAPGKTERAHGLLSFYQGADVRAEFKRLAADLNRK